MPRSLFPTRMNRILGNAARRLLGEPVRVKTRFDLGVDPLEPRALLATVTVHIYNNEFSTNPIGQPVADPTINVGDTIHWVWDEGFHNTQSLPGQAESWNSGDPTSAVGHTFDHTFSHTGTFTYICIVHGTDNGNGTASGMAGTITVAASPTPTPTPTPTATPTSTPLVTVTGVQVTKKKQKVTGVTVAFSGAVNATEAANFGTYVLTAAGKRGAFDAPNAKAIPMRSAVYDTVHNLVTLTPRKPFALKKAVEVKIKGQSPDGLQDTSGRLIDGDNNGTATGDARFVLSRKGVSRAAIALTSSGGHSIFQVIAAGVESNQEVVVGIMIPVGPELGKSRASR